jgi:tRNA threonylcarbamoyladenosine biosynthesis protein TsaB
MLVLALDTTTRGGSCALVRDRRTLHEAAGDPARPHDLRLPGDLQALLDASGQTLDAIDAVAVATGPGSFTGLRIGIAAMQGLAFAAGKPLIGVSGFDALAQVAANAAADTPTHHSTGRGPLIATWVDAWRGEVFTALYEDGDELEAPTVEHPETVLSRLRDRPTIFIGDGAAPHRTLIADKMGTCARIADPVSPLLAGTIGAMAADAIAAGHAAPPHAIRPLYVRRPAVELVRDARPVR